MLILYVDLVMSCNYIVASSHWTEIVEDHGKSIILEMAQLLEESSAYGYSMICLRSMPCSGAQLSTSQNLREMETLHFLAKNRKRLGPLGYINTVYQWSWWIHFRYGRKGIQEMACKMRRKRPWNGSTMLHSVWHRLSCESSEPSEASTRFATLSSPHFKRPAGRTCDTKTSQLLSSTQNWYKISHSAEHPWVFVNTLIHENARNAME